MYYSVFSALRYLSILTIQWPLQDSSVWGMVSFGQTTLPGDTANLIYRADMAHFNGISVPGPYKDDIL